MGLGVDFGSTKVAAGLVDESGQILNGVRRRMISSGMAEAGLEAVRAAIDAALESGSEAEVTAIGRSPGPWNPRSGVLLNPPNLPCRRNFPLAAESAGMYWKPVYLENDGRGRRAVVQEFGCPTDSAFAGPLGGRCGDCRRDRLVQNVHDPLRSKEKNRSNS
jgi:hypothetical protein